MSAAAGNCSDPVAPPAAKKVEHRMEMFGDVRIDNYYWLRDDSRSDPDVLSHLQRENAYADSAMAGEPAFFAVLIVRVDVALRLQSPFEYGVMVL